MNIYRNGEWVDCGKIYSTEQEAKKYAPCIREVIATVKIEWEESVS